jgi:hypothetical protein
VVALGAQPRLGFVVDVDGRLVELADVADVVVIVQLLDLLGGVCRHLDEPQVRIVLAERDPRRDQ